MTIGSDDVVGRCHERLAGDHPVFLDFKIGCVGCPIACFHIVVDACGEHHVGPDTVLKALCEVVASH